MMSTSASEYCCARPAFAACSSALRSLGTPPSCSPEASISTAMRSAPVSSVSFAAAASETASTRQTRDTIAWRAAAWRALVALASVVPRVDN